MIVLDIKRVKARKQHHCDMCGKVIEVGEEYEAQNLINDSIYTFHQCDRCKPYVDEACESGLDGYCYEGLHPAVFEEYMWDNHRDVISRWYGMDDE